MNGMQIAKSKAKECVNSQWWPGLYICTNYHTTSGCTVFVERAENGTYDIEVYGFNPEVYGFLSIKCSKVQLGYTVE